MSTRAAAKALGLSSPGRAPEVLIVGGGLAGSAAAILLARAGRAVTLVERDPGLRHKVCGEFLSHETLRYLGSLGLDLNTLGAVPIGRVRLAGVRRATAAALPFPAMSLTRCCLDDALLRLAEAAGARVLRGEAVQSLEAVAGGPSATPAALPGCARPWLRATLSGGESLEAPAVFLATGKHDLRGYPRYVQSSSRWIAFKQYFRLEPAQAAALAGHVELLTYRGGYAGLQLVEGGLANLCCLVEANEFGRHGGSWPLLLRSMQAQSPHLAARLMAAEPQLERPLALSHIPYGFVRKGDGVSQPPGLWHLGDQAAVIPSFTGDGMALALHTAHLAVGMYLDGRSASSFQAEAANQLGGQVRRAALIAQLLLGSATRPLALAAASLWPGVLRVVASQTRIERALCGEPGL